MTQPTNAAEILIVDDQPEIRAVCKAVLAKAGHKITEAGSGEDGLAILKDKPMDVLLLDYQLPGISGMDLLKTARRKFPDVEVVMMTAFGSFETAVEAIKTGAYDFLSKPFKDTALISMAVGRALERKRLVERARELESQAKRGSETMIGNSPKMQHVYKMIEDVSSSDCTVLITGESGTGKELVARSLHAQSPRHERVFLAVNCAALTDSLLESELFGHIKGAFTGATGNKRGLFESANFGTILLDEIGDVSPATQVKLLRTLQEGEVRPVGGAQSLKVDVRVIAATNRPLEKLVEKGKFRQDLFYRLNVVTIELPALRERQGDIAVLAHFFLEQFAKRYKKSVKGFSPEVLEMLEKHTWAGNVRELQHAMERAVVMTKSGTIGLEVLPPTMMPSAVTENMSGMHNGAVVPYKTAKNQMVSAFTRSYVENLLKKSNGSIAKAAGMAGMERSNFRRLVEKYNAAKSGKGASPAVDIDDDTDDDDA